MRRTRAGDGATFDRFATRVGHLDSPFYDEERERDVWNEASAVAFQLLLWSIPLVATAVMWVGGAGVLAPVGVMMLPWLAAAAMALVYAYRQGVDPANHRAFSPGRLWAWAGVQAALGAGILRAGLQLEPVGVGERFARGAAEGAGVGLMVVGLVMAAVTYWLRRRRER